LRKIFPFFELREIEMGAWLQNIGTKEFVGRILQYKELGDVRIAGFRLDCLRDALVTFPL
jgi:hypothetical protein